MPSKKNRRRGFWKRVKKVRPVNEEIEVAESQYYSNAVNQLGESITKSVFERPGKSNAKVVVTTYKPNYQFLKDFFEVEDDQLDAIPNIDLHKVASNKPESSTEMVKESLHSTTRSDLKKNNSSEKLNPGDMDLGTGTPDPTLDDATYYSESTEPTSSSSIDRSDGFSFMDYLFGVTSSDDIESPNSKADSTKSTQEADIRTTPLVNHETETETTKLKTTTENSYIPEEITAEVTNNVNEDVTESIADISRNTTNINPSSKEEDVTHKTLVKVESSSVSSFMDPANVVSTSMSTEVSHETEICFRGKCIKTNKILL